MSDVIPTEQRVEREDGCWSDNTAAGYANALHRCKGRLQDALAFLEQDQVVRAQEAMNQAQACMDEAHRWFNHSNNAHWRIKALATEVAALRRGAAISYADPADDPLSDDWRLKR